MFLPRAVFDKLISTIEGSKKDQVELAGRFLEAHGDNLERSLQRVLAAKESEVKALVAIKDDQIKFLRTEVERLLVLVKHERDRAEAAIDQRIVAAAGEPVRHADLQRKLAENEVEGMTPEKTKHAKDKGVELAKIMAMVNSVVEDSDEKDDLSERIVSIGGQPVAHT